MCGRFPQWFGSSASLPCGGASKYSADVRTVFFGTPAIAVPALVALHDTSDLVGVVCQPDRPSGRGLKLTACAVKQSALQLGLDVHQPVKVRTGNLHAWLAEREVDVAVVMAYGRILPRVVLDTPRLGCVNLHASLLPKYRGAAPIQWAIMNGETETGICLMQMEEGLDTGPVHAMRRIPIAPEMDAGTLAQALSELAATVIREDLPHITDREAVPQDSSRATLAPPIERHHCQLDFRRTAGDLVNQVRGLAPRPGAVTTLETKRLRIVQAAVAEASSVSQPAPGRISRCEGDQLWVECGRGQLAILEAQVEGRRTLRARDLINGRVLRAGQQVGST